MKKNLFSKMTAMLLTLVLILGLACPAFAAEEEGVVIKLHYNRPDG